MTPPRPTRIDAAGIERVVGKILPSVIRWLGQPEEKPEDVSADLIRVIDQGFRTDAYELTKSLERLCHWDCDGQLVGVLERVDGLVYREIQNAIASWIKDNCIVPNFSVGDVVKFSSYVEVAGKIEWVTATGEILEVNSEQGYYVVNSAQLGHNNAEQRARRAVGTIGIHVNFEIAEKV